MHISLILVLLCEITRDQSNQRKGCHRRSRGYKGQLLINKMLVRTANRMKRNLAWIDYMKAFDSVPHSWILESLNMYRARDTIIRFVEYSMRDGKTELMYYHQSKTDKIIIKRWRAGWPNGFVVETQPALGRERYINGRQEAPLTLCIWRYINEVPPFFGVKALAIPVTTISFGMLEWRMSEMERMDRKTRNLLTMDLHGLHHP